jgi:small-conductance mechanosensitive channel
METWYLQLTYIFKEWAPAIVVIAGTLFIKTLTKAILRRIHKDRKWTIIRQLSPSISNVIYIIGLKLFVDLSPFEGRVETWLNHVVYVFSIIIYLGLIQRAALIGIEWSAFKGDSSKTLQNGFIPLLRNVITLFAFFSGGIMILKHFNYDVMSLITALGVSSLAVGLAAKDTLSNMISGFILIIDQNLRPGDRINLGGTLGDVEEIGLRSTQMRLGDGNTLIVPNAELVNTKILNLSIPSRAMTCSVSIRIPYSFPFSEIKEICISTLKQVQKAAQEKPNWVNLTSLSEGHQFITIGFWVTDMNDSGAAISEFNERLLARFKDDKITLVSPVISIPTS